MHTRNGAIEIDGRRYAWHASGSGPRLILVNGYAGTGEDWDPAFLGLLVERFEVICPDNRGMGDSELGEEELTIAAMAEDVEALMDALEIEAAAVCGWSMGGYVVQAPIPAGRTPCRPATPKPSKSWSTTRGRRASRLRG